MKRGKKGLQLMFETYVAIILAILVLVVLIISWDLQTGKFSSMVNEFIGKSNVDSTIAACNSLVARQAQYEYCCAEKELKYEDEGKTVKEQLTCSQISLMKIGEKMEKLECSGVC